MQSTKAAKRTKTSAAPKVARSRTSATEKHFIPNYPQKLFIYKLPASSFWWARYFVNGNAVRKSTKTQGKREAMEFAKTFYDTITYNARHGFAATMSASSFEGCMKEMLKAEKAKVSRGELSKISCDNSVYRYNKSITPYFGRMEVRDINYMAVDGYLNELSKKDLSSSTITAYLGLTRKVLSYAAKRNLITAVPEFPSVRLVDKARGWFTWHEYRRLQVQQHRQHMHTDHDLQALGLDHASLAQFTGSEKYYRISRRHLLTDGTKYLAEKAGCFWMMDAIASHLSEIGTAD